MLTLEEQQAFIKTLSKGNFSPGFLKALMAAKGKKKRPAPHRNERQQGSGKQPKIFG
jgi:hypothetical protein